MLALYIRYKNIFKKIYIPQPSPKCAQTTTVYYLTCKCWLSLSDLIMLPNCLFSTVVPNCPRCQSVLFLLWCQIVLFLLRCQIVLLYIAVPNCPGAKMSWCLNVLGAKVSSFTLRCQIVLVPNCHGTKLS